MTPNEQGERLLATLRSLADETRKLREEMTELRKMLREVGGKLGSSAGGASILGLIGKLAGGR